MVKINEKSLTINEIRHPYGLNFRWINRDLLLTLEDLPSFAKASRLLNLYLIWNDIINCAKEAKMIFYGWKFQFASWNDGEIILILWFSSPLWKCANARWDDDPYCEIYWNGIDLLYFFVHAHKNHSFYIRIGMKTLK